MGNSNSGSFNTANSPPPWTQSLPRDAHKHKKYGAMQQGTKVLPERIPGQRLRPTENGRILHYQGTISHRKLMESLSAPNGEACPKISHEHSTSMSALNLSPSMSPRTIITEPIRGNILLPQRKTFKSEPDLREINPLEIRYPQSPNPLHTIIHESPTKERIISKKRYKAPPPPEKYNPELPAIRIDKLSPKTKSRKTRIFKKNSTAKVTKNDCEENLIIKSGPEVERRLRHIKKGLQEFEETKDITNSLDNLHYNVQKNKDNKLYPMHIISINTPERNLYSEYRAKSIQQNNKISDFPSRSIKKENEDHSYGDVHKANIIIDKTTQFKGDKYLDRGFHNPNVNNKDNLNVITDPISNERYNSIDVPDFSEGITKKHCQATRNKNNKIEDYNEDPWDKAEREWIEKKINSEILQKEITNAAKKLKKVPLISKNRNEHCDLNQSDDIQFVSNIKQSNINKSEPKTFFFGMESDPNTDLAVNSVDDGNQILPEINIKTSLNDKVSKSLDRHNKNQLEYGDESKNEKKNISTKIDEFVANIERNKSNLKPSQADLLQSIFHEDGGYHSRQGSETWQTENDKYDSEKIKMNLRPTLPKRQLELPRFSPNAAWRSLGIETSPRSKENLSDTLENTGSIHIQEEKSHRGKHLLSSRVSGEKSGDSGISGDGGSPGLVSDFEPIILKKHDVYNGPIAISSPISSSKLENKRAWTPAQDLDDNSFEDSGDQSSKMVPHDIPAFPKLTSRTNMFSDIMENNITVNSQDGTEIRINSLENNKNEGTIFNRNEMPQILEHSTHVNIPTYNKIHDNLPYNGDDNNEDNWRENWSLSRSIPNSINKCGENDCNSNSSYIHGTRSESRMSNGDGKLVSRPITPSHMHGCNAGHIMYLPQYKTYNLKNKAHIGDCHSVSGNEVIRPFLTDKFSSPKMTVGNVRNMGDIALEKKKKFAYKSTVRILEKRFLEEKLSKDTQEKEDRRLKEMDEIMKVEKEFRNKREKEKIRLKRQLQLINSNQPDSLPKSNNGPITSEDMSKVKIEKYRNESIPTSFTQIREEIFQNGHQSDSPDYSYSAKEPLEDPVSFISGVKKWVKGRKKHTNGGGYVSDASSTTITSGSRQEPDGAPATSNRCDGENFREVIIAGSRSRNGSVIIGESPYSSEFDSEVRYRPRGDFSSDMQSNTSGCTSVSSDQKRSYTKHSFPIKQSDPSCRRYSQKSSKSPAASESSRTSSRRPYSPNMKRTLSPDSKKSLASEPVLLTQEIYEDSRDSRKYKEYRISCKRPTSQQSMKYYKNARDNELIDNYRRNFAQGQMLNYPHRSSHEEYENRPRPPNDVRISRKNGMNPARNYSIDTVEPVPHRKSPLRQSLSYNYRVPSIDSSPARFAVNHITPFKQSEEFRPVVFNSNSNKVLSVT